MRVIGPLDSLSRPLALVAVALILQLDPAAAHEVSFGALRIDHPYATPTLPGAGTGAAFLRGIRNTGDQADRLLGARTPLARRVEIRSSVIDAQNVLRARIVDGIDLPPRSGVRLRHDGAHQLTLIGLVAPLNNGDRFPMTLRFERAGEREVTVWVQQPRDVAASQPRPH